MLVSRYYEARMWTNHERRAAQARAIVDEEGYILPVRLDSTPIPGLLETTAYLSVPPETPRSLALAIQEKLGRKPAQPEPSHCSREPRISIAHLPATRAELFGRETELSMLDTALTDATINIAVVAAWGGAGKSALVNNWLKRTLADAPREIRQVYGWSFYSQGTENDTSAEPFVDSALRWFGDPDPLAGSAWDRGKRLSEYVQRQPTLLILDGLEPLQYGFGNRQGRLRDDAMVSLVRELAMANPGLCLISTRVLVPDLDAHRDSVLTIQLDPLTPAAGAEVLRSLGAWGDDIELETTSTEYGGHGLALTLLGALLAEAVRGDVRRRNELVHDVTLNEERRQGRHARRVLRYYEKWLGAGAELAILQMVGLFDRPAPRSLIASLVQARIDKLTSEIPPVGSPAWRRALSHLRESGLLAPESVYDPDTLDAHPLVREYFGDRIQEHDLDVWRKGHKLIFEFLQRATPEHPTDLLMMAPLYSAVAHGCKAGLYRQAFENVYWKRILREYNYFSTYEIAAFGSELAALGAFFTRKWDELPEELTPYQKGLLLSQVGYCLRAVGSLSEATSPLSESVDILAGLGRWRDAAVPSENLSRTFLPMGEISRAIDEASRSMALADKSEDLFLRVDKRTVLADALHKHGDLEDASRYFQEAEQLLGTRLTSFGGARYCDFLLTIGSPKDAIARCSAELENLEPGRKGYLLRGLNSLYISQARQILTNEWPVVAAFDMVNNAVDYFRRAGRLDYLPEALIARAGLATRMQDFDLADNDLSEAVLLSNRGEMKINLIDAHLGQAAMHLARQQVMAAQSALAEAGRLTRGTSYGRATARFDELSAQLGHVTD